MNPTADNLLYNHKTAATEVISLMANDGIRLPSDSTVASQKVHRGSRGPDTQVSQNTPKEVRKPSPLLTVVLQNNPVIQGKSEQLFELVLQNEPKSAPAIRVLTDAEIKPGTSLLLELDENQQYRPVEKPNNDQLAKLVKLELDFWRAHLLPKTDDRTFPNLPNKADLAQLSQQLPALKPLLQWLTQAPTQLNAKLVQQWIQEFSPLASLRQHTWPTATQPTNHSNATTLTANTGQPSHSQNAVNFPLLSVANLSTSTQSGKPIFSTGALVNPALMLPPVLSANSQNLMAADVRLQQPIGLAGPWIQLNPNIKLTNLPAVAQPSANLNTPNRAPVMPPTNELLTAKFQLLGQVFKTAPNTRLTPELIQQFTPVRFHGLAVPATPTANQASPVNLATGKNAAAEAQQRATALQANSAKPHAASLNGSSTIASRTAQIVGQLSNQQTNNNATVGPHQNKTQPGKSPMLAGQATIPLANNNSAGMEPSTPNNPLLATAKPSATAAAFTAMQPPAGAHSAGGRIPPEINLGLWLNEINQQINNSPAHLSQDLKQKAAELLQQSGLSAEKLINSNTPLGHAQKSETDDSALLALRNWVDATQARIQNSAIQNAIHQWAGPEQTVQQMQLPLIWLGLTHWVDIEWWQETPKKKNSKKNKKDAAKQWRMKLFLTLKPLAPICADIHWQTEATNLTFWSQDSATLAHLNQLLPTLNSWTQGLGEKTITTKHGMPNKAAKQDEQQSSEQHLVDIRT